MIVNDNENSYKMNSSSSTTERDCQKGKGDDYENFVRRARTGSTKSVHFDAADLSNKKENFEMTNKELSANYFHLVISVFSLCIGSVAIGGCILLYLELTEMNTEFETQKSRIFGSKNSAFEKSSQIAPQYGWIFHFQNRLGSVDQRIDDMKKWINMSACVEGHDFTTR